MMSTSGSSTGRGDSGPLRPSRCRPRHARRHSRARRAAHTASRYGQPTASATCPASPPHAAPRFRWALGPSSVMEGRQLLMAKQAYFHTLLRTTQKGASLSAQEGGKVKEIGVLVERCRTCGTIHVLLGHRVLKTVSLADQNGFGILVPGFRTRKPARSRSVSFPPGSPC